MRAIDVDNVEARIARSACSRHEVHLDALDIGKRHLPGPGGPDDLRALGARCDAGRARGAVDTGGAAVEQLKTGEGTVPMDCLRGECEIGDVLLIPDLRRDSRGLLGVA